MKTCSKCKVSKNLEDFHKCKKSKDNRFSWCKTCVSKKDKKYYDSNIEKVKIRHAKYWVKNKDRELIRIKDYHIKNKEQIRKHNTKYIRLKRKIDINQRLRDNLRTRLRQALKRNQKTGSAISDLGCCIEKFILWIEMQWEEGMNWNNYGKNGWHIDHIKPLTLFDLTNRIQLLQACHFSNLQPLWEKENIIKGNKYAGIS